MVVPKVVSMALFSKRSRSEAMTLLCQFHAFLGILAPEWRPYVNFLKAIHRYVGFAAWALANWISFQSLINLQGADDKSEGAGLITSNISTGWFGLWISFAILVLIKLAVQVIAHNYHERAFADVRLKNFSCFRGRSANLPFFVYRGLRTKSRASKPSRSSTPTHERSQKRARIN